MKPVTIEELDRSLEVLTQWIQDARTVRDLAVSEGKHYTHERSIEAEDTLIKMTWLVSHARNAIIDVDHAMAREAKIPRSVFKVNYSQYGRRLGYAPLPGKEKEHQLLCEALYDLNSQLRLRLSENPKGNCEGIRRGIHSTKQSLAEVSYPNMYRKSW